MLKRPPKKIPPGASPRLPRQAVRLLVPLALAVVCLLTAVVGALLYGNQRGREGGRILHDSHVEVVLLQDTLTRLAGAEAGQRGYLLTGSARCLTSYQQDRARAASDLDDLQRLAGEDPAQQRQVRRLRPRIGARLDELQQTLDLSRQGRPGAGLRAVRSGRGERLMDGVRAELSRMQAVQSDLSASQEAGLEAGGRRGMFLVGGVVTLVGVLLTVAVWAVVHLLRRQALADDQIGAYNTVLEFQKVQIELTNAELAQANAELTALATTDGLTGLRNRRAFDERLAAEFGRASRYGLPLSLVLLDIDHFKQYNDGFGHLAGDEVLRTVARVLQRAARETDFLARYGGEEIAILMPGTDGDGAVQVAERARLAVARAGWEQRAVTASLGVCSLGPGVGGPEDMVARADRALYRSKAGGRDRVTQEYAPTPDRLPLAAGAPA